MQLLRKILAGATAVGRERVRDASRGTQTPPSAIRVDVQVASAVAEHNAAGRYARSLALVTEALAAKPKDTDLILMRASTLFAWGRFREARQCLDAIAKEGAGNTALYLQLGWSCYYTGKLDEGEAWIRRVVASDTANSSAQFVLAAILQAQRRLDEAFSCYARGIELCPGDAQAYVMSAICKLDQGDPVAAEEFCRRAIAIDDRLAIAWANLGAALGSQDRFDEAFVPFERAVHLEQSGSQACDSFVNFATNLREVGRTRDAFLLYEQNLAQHPNVTGLGDYSLALLTDGQFTEGWELYEFRWMKEPFLSMRQGFRKPVWAGQDLQGKTILLCAEQGFGDIIQFIRYAGMLKRLGATVLLQARPGFEPLATGLSAVDRIYDRGTTLPPFDYYIHLMSLPRVFGTQLNSIPADIPYVFPEPARVERCSLQLGARGVLKVGLAWAGNPSHARDRLRSMSFRQFAPLLEVQGARFYSLQKSRAGKEEPQLLDSELIDLGPLLNDFGDTAAVISQLDLVVCVDTAIAHLAGAMGITVWLLLPQPADFRWLEDREDSPWYPTMRLFRQRRRGEWGDVIARVKAALQERVQEGERRATRLAEPAGQTVSLAPRRPGETLRRSPGISAVAECRDGILQYLPGEPLVGDSLGLYGEFLQSQLNLLTGLIKPGGTVLEAGSGVGAHALSLAAAVGETGHLLLYEPRPLVQRILYQNLHANRVNNVTVMRRLLGGRGASDTRSTGGAPSASGVSRTPAAGDLTETVDELQLQRLDWLKINAHVPAGAVLDGAVEALWHLRPLLFVTALKQETLADLALRAREFSYRCWKTETPLFNANNFNRCDRDIFAGRTAWALLAIPEEIEMDVVLEQCVEVL